MLNIDENIASSEDAADNLRKIGLVGKYQQNYRDYQITQYFIAQIQQYLIFNHKQDRISFK